MTTSFQNQEVIELRCGEAQVLCAPHFGARLLTWNIGTREMLYWPDDADWQSGESLAKTRGGNPILFPFIARHYWNGEMGKWRDENGAVREMPMHGFAREMPFEVVECDAQNLRMRLVSDQQTRAYYPFEFRFDVVYRLNESTLETTFETTNTGETPLPYYAGHHFYFAIDHARRADWQIEIPAQKWGLQNPDGSVAFTDATSTRFTLDDAQLVDRFHLEFTEPRATLQNTASGETIRAQWDEEYSDLWRYVTTWTLSKEADFYCVEPWLGLPNAIHHGHGLRHVAPGETETATCRLTAA